MKKLLLLQVCMVVLSLLVGPLLSAQTNLSYYLEQGRLLNPILQNLQLEKEIAVLEISKIGNQFNRPQWTATADYLFAPFFFNKGRVLSITTMPDVKAFGYDVATTSGGLYAGLANVNYPLFTKRQSTPWVRQQEISQLALQNQSLLLEADLKRRITSDYLNAYLIQQQMDYANQVKDRLIKQKEFIQKLAGRGIMRITDVELISLEIKNQDFQLSNLSSQYRQALQVLNTDVGISDTSLFRLEKVDLVVKDTSAATVFLEQYRLDSLSAANDQGIFETRYVPQVNVFANSGINAVEINNIYRKVGLSAGIHVSWLIGDGGQRHLNAQQNEIRKLTARNQKVFARQQIKNNRQNNLLVLAQIQQNIRIIASQLEGYQALMSTYRQEFALGQLSVIDYLNVLKTFADLQQQKAIAETELLLVINEINYWNN